MTYQKSEPYQSVSLWFNH